MFMTSCSTSGPVVDSAVPLAAKLLREVNRGQVLNVNIVEFESGLATEAVTFDAVTAAEIRYLPVVLRRVLQDSGNWGAIRVLPAESRGSELQILGRVLASDGVELSVHITATDSTGRVWVDKTYTDYAYDHAYGFAQASLTEPFINLIHSIAHDSLNTRLKLSDPELDRLLDVAALRYAADIAPTVFGSYLESGADGSLVLTGLPSRSDPMFARVNRIREAEYVFVDTVDQEYTGLHERMRVPYAFWRRYSYDLLTYNRAISRVSEDQSAVTFEEMKTVYERYQESRMNEDELREMAAAFDAEVSETVFELEGTVINLSGSIDFQYQEWRQILREIYSLERGATIEESP